MKKLKFLALPTLLSVFFLISTAFQAGKETERLQKAATVVREFGKMKERIPHNLFDQAEGIIIIPGMINGGFVVGGKRGKGVAMVKQDGSWSNPVFVTFTGGSIGFQVGVQSVDLILVFKHKATLEKMENGDFTIGGDVSAAAGPVGRSSTASTDYKLEAEVYSYSRSKGLFAGISINGSNIAVDNSANRAFYSKSMSTHEIFMSGRNNSSALADLKSALKAL